MSRRVRWGAGAVVLAAALVPLAGAAGPAKRPAPAPPDNPGEYDVLRAQLAARAAWDHDRLRREALRPEALLGDADRSPLDVIWRRTGALLRHLRARPDAPGLTREATELAALRPAVTRLHDAGDAAEPERRAVFDRVAAVRRRIALKNPLLDFDAVLFVQRHRALFEHMCDQYYGITARPGGGLYVLEGAFGPQPRLRDVLAGATVCRGRLAGQRLTGGPATPAGALSYDGLGRLTDRRPGPAGGAFLSPELSFDGRDVLFAYTECRGDPVHRFPARPEDGQWDPGRCWHLFRARLDGTGLEQLTDGPANDFDPCFLPDGRIAFVSDRCGGYLRCDRVCPVYTLYALAPDGTVSPLSRHETHEWHPSVTEDGQVLYTRWDYVDRDSDVAHHLWTCRPDGGNPRSPHGNYPARRELRPWMELSPRAVPGSPGKVLAVAAPHHGQAFGSLVLIDTARPDDGAMSQVRRFTPETPLIESERAPGVPHPRGTANPRAEVYGTPWPLDADFCLCVYNPAVALAAAAQGDKPVSPATGTHGLYLVDSFGNKELLYRDPHLSCSEPIPVRPRRRPPAVVAPRAEGGAAGAAWAGVVVANVYDSAAPWPAGTRIKELRVVNFFAKTTPPADRPYIGHAAQSLARGVLGTAPVEPDGSAHFLLPPGAPVAFQALDEHGRAVQTMRSLTYAQPGERLACAGCHESRARAPAASPAAVPLALRRAPSHLVPEAEGSYPLTFPRLVQPVLDAHCVPCHDREPKAPGLRGDRFGEHGWSQAFAGLRKYAWGMSGGNGTALAQPQVSRPGQVGARASRLLPLLERGHHGVTLAPAELRRITLWLDCNSNFYGAYTEPDRQARGEVVRPVLGLPLAPDFETLRR